MHVQIIFLFIAVLMLSPLLSACNSHQKPVDSEPNVLFILIDTLRQDHLSIYGYDRKTSPAIDRLAMTGAVFDNHISHAGQTVPSTLSLMLSQYPVEHGVVHRFNGQFAKNPPYYPDSFLFLSEVFQSAGYKTAAFIGNPFLNVNNRFNQGFDHFIYRKGFGQKLSNTAKKWLNSYARSRDAPFFMYIHFMDVHGPYKTPKKYADRYHRPAGGKLMCRNGLVDQISQEDLDYTVASYDAAINYVDDLISDILNELDQLKLRENTIIVVTSDHGDEFMEHHGLGHGTTVYGELVCVPLIISYSKKIKPGTRISHISQHLDLAPTILDLAGIEKPKSFRGESVFKPAVLVFAEDRVWRAAYAKGHKIVHNLNTIQSEIFNAKDKLDQHPLENLSLKQELQQHLNTYLHLEATAKTQSTKRESVREWSEDEIEELRALGYVE
jgi:arylsulfatase A-like enzyme